MRPNKLTFAVAAVLCLAACGTEDVHLPYIPGLTQSPPPPPRFEIPQPDMVHMDPGTEIPSSWQEAVRSGVPKIADQSVIFLGRGLKKPMYDDPWFGLVQVELEPEAGLADKRTGWVKIVGDVAGVTDVSVLPPRETYTGHTDGRAHDITEANPIRFKGMYIYDGYWYPESGQYAQLSLEERQAIRRAVVEVWLYDEAKDEFRTVTRFMVDVTFTSRMLIGGIWWTYAKDGTVQLNFQPGYDF